MLAVRALPQFVLGAIESLAQVAERLSPIASLPRLGRRGAVVETLRVVVVDGLVGEVPGWRLRH